MFVSHSSSAMHMASLGGSLSKANGELEAQCDSLELSTQKVRTELISVESSIERKLELLRKLTYENKAVPSNDPLRFRTEGIQVASQIPLLREQLSLCKEKGLKLRRIQKENSNLLEVSKALSTTLETTRAELRGLYAARGAADVETRARREKLAQIREEKEHLAEILAGFKRLRDSFSDKILGKSAELHRQNMKIAELQSMAADTVLSLRDL